MCYHIRKLLPLSTILVLNYIIFDKFNYILANYSDLKTEMSVQCINIGDYITGLELGSVFKWGSDSNC